MYAESHNYFFAEVSALTGEGIDDLFFKKLSTQIKKQFSYEEKTNRDQEEEKLKINLQENLDKNIKNKKKKKCCWCFKY